MVARHVFKRVRSVTIDPLLWLAAVIGYFLLVALLKVMSWLHLLRR